MKRVFEKLYRLIVPKAAPREQQTIPGKGDPPNLTISKSLSIIVFVQRPSKWEILGRQMRALLGCNI